MNDTAELKHFLVHALELEADAMTRFQELAETLRAHNNLEVAEFFDILAEEAARHLQEVRSDAAARELPTLAAWEYDWPAEPPESLSYESVHYRMDLRKALELALASERAAQAYYAQVADSATDAETARLAAGYAAEEVEHIKRLEDRMASLPPTSPSQFEDDDPAHSPE